MSNNDNNSVGAGTDSSFSLTDEASADVLLKSIQYLNVVDTGRLATASKRMYYLVKQYRQLTLEQKPDLVTVILKDLEQDGSEDGDGRQALQSAIEKMRTKPDLALSYEREQRSRGLLKDALERKFDASTVICGVISPSIQVNLPAGATDDDTKETRRGTTKGPSSSTVSHDHLCALMTASFADSTILPFCLGRQRDDGVENLTRRMKEIEDAFNEKQHVNTVRTDDDIRQSFGNKRKLADDKDQQAKQTVPTSFWKTMIVYACGSMGMEIVEQFVQTVQLANPSMVIVGGVCTGGYISLGKGDVSLKPSYSKDDLSVMTVRELKKLATRYGSTEDDVDISTLVEKQELADYVHCSLQRVDKSSSSEVTLTRDGIFGIVCGGNIPVRSMVSRGVKSLMSENDQDSTSWIVHEFETVKPDDESFPERLRWLAVPDHWRFHFIESIKNEDTGKILQANQVLGMPAVLDADFIGIRDGSKEEGFELKQWDGQLSHMLDKIVLIDDKVGSSDPPPKEIDFFGLDGQACLEDMDLAVSTLKEQTTSANEEVLCALMISCNGRGPVSPFMDDETMADARRFNNSFPEVPCLGFYAGGEIGPLARARRNGHNVYRQGSVAFQGVSNFKFFSVPCVLDEVMLTSLRISLPLTLQQFTAVFALFIVPKIDRPLYNIDDSAENVQKYVDQHLGMSPPSI